MEVREGWGDGGARDNLRLEEKIVTICSSSMQRLGKETHLGEKKEKRIVVPSKAGYRKETWGLLTRERSGVDVRFEGDSDDGNESLGGGKKNEKCLQGCLEVMQRFRRGITPEYFH